MQDVVKNATTELISGQKITGELTMKLKTLLHSCTMDNVNILLMDCNHDYTETKIKIRERKEIRKRKDFCDFIETYGDSVVNGWAIESENGIPCIIFDLENLVMKGIPTVKPKSRKELIKIIDETIKKEGNNCDLNFIDVSLIKNMSWLFFETKFNGDISKWNVSKVKDMRFMFCKSKFNGDISNWNVSNVENMECMFDSSNFNGNISDWNVKNVENMSYMFNTSKFNKDISKWDVSKVKDMTRMFIHSQFNGDISNWDVSNVEKMRGIFVNSPLEKNPPEWY